MDINFDPSARMYSFHDISETEFQILYRAFQYDRPYSDIPELDIYSRDMQDKFQEAQDALIRRYA